MAGHGGFLILELEDHFNNDAVSFVSGLSDGGFNVWGNTFPGEELPPSLSVVEVGGVPFRFPPKEDGRLNSLVCRGQSLAVPPGRYDWVYVLAAGERRTEDWVYLHYASGATDPEWLRVSDFWPSPAHFGEVAAFRCHHMHYPRHVQVNMGPVMWRQRIAVPRHEELVAVSLPDNVAIHIFAATLARPPAGTAGRRVGCMGGGPGGGEPARQ